MKIVRSLLKNLANANPNIWGYVTLQAFFPSGFQCVLIKVIIISI